MSDLFGVYYHNVIGGFEPTGDSPHFDKFSGTPEFWFYYCYYTPVSYGELCLTNIQ